MNMFAAFKWIGSLCLVGLAILAYNPNGEPNKLSDAERSTEYIQTQNSRFLYELRELRRDLDFNDDASTTETKNKILGRIGGPVQACKDMFAALDKAKDAALALNNTDYPWFNWIKNTFSGFDEQRRIKLSNLSFENSQIYHAGGGATGYFSKRNAPFDPDNAPFTTGTIYDANMRYFKINESNGSSCDLNDW
jgi:hypothetical protein